MGFHFVKTGFWEESNKRIKGALNLEQLIQNTAGRAEWGNIEGNISDQADLQAALDSVSAGKTVESFGAIGNGVADDTAAIQAAFNSISTTLGGNIIFGAGKRYKITSTLTIPKMTAGILYLIGYSSTILTTVANITLFQHKTTTNAQAQQMTGGRIIIQGFTFQGSFAANQIGVYLGPSYGSVIKDCYFSFLTIGVSANFALMGNLINCLFTNCTDRAISIQSANADIPDAPISLGSNVFAVDHCRVFNRAGCFASIYVFNSSGVTLRDIITEGNTPQSCVYWITSTTVVRDLTIEGWHNECDPTEAMLNVTMPVSSNPVIKVSDIFNQFTCVMVKAQGTGGNIIIDNNVVMVTGCTFTKGAAKWNFKNVNNVNYFTPAYWDGGTLPSVLKSDTYQDIDTLVYFEDPLETFVIVNAVPYTITQLVVEPGLTATIKYQSNNLPYTLGTALSAGIVLILNVNAEGYVQFKGTLP